MHTVMIRKGTYRCNTIENVVFTVVRPLNNGANGMFITVDGSGHPGFPDRAIRVKIADAADIEIDGKTAPRLTDQEIMDKMRAKFQVLDDMTYATLSSIVRGLIVTGPPGIGKSFGVEKIIDEADILRKLGDSQVKFGVEKGTASPVGLFMLLHEYSAKGSLLVLDDSDTILYDEASLNLLKAALDSGKKRRLNWRTESRALENAGIPNSFEFKGAIIFITNLDFEKSRGKIGAHLEAIMSRCHYLDMGIHGTHEKFLRCKQIVADGMLQQYGFTETEQAEILEYIQVNQNNLRELSLRMVTKIADLHKMDNVRWKSYANSTCLRTT